MPAAEVPVVQPVQFQAASVSLKSDKDPNIRDVVLKGNVYVSQGSERSDLFLELRRRRPSFS